MTDRVWQLAQTAAVVAAIALFISRPDWTEERSLLTGPPVAPPQDGEWQGVYDTRLIAPDWPIQIAAASLVLMPTGTSKSIKTSVEAPPKGGQSAAKAKRRVSMPTIKMSTKPQSYLQVAERGSKEVKY